MVLAGRRHFSLILRPVHPEDGTRGPEMGLWPGLHSTAQPHPGQSGCPKLALRLQVKQVEQLREGVGGEGGVKMPS